MDSTTIITSFLDALESSDGDALVGFLDEDAVHDDGHGERIVGGSAIRDALIERVSALNERHTDRLVLVSQAGDRVAVETTLRGTYERSLDGWPEAGGQSFSVPAGLFFEVEGAKIVRFSRYLDQRAMTAALK
ncbi:nuclear transport factor 2 family protein [Rhizobium sp. EC-SD404]|uniref:nuclear transport factor 2 family protein n=1 Tax=Rhizobium sp. EC-SD404 TaxID=2038389 RepID=UPI001256521E|nr:nuclear transport factor 2 family protein [Rhizobium sp. EC-SD404]VVT27031.1 conserved hypothetical protein [Rhizobium sp. EC-SD404]